MINSSISLLIAELTDYSSWDTGVGEGLAVGEVGLIWSSLWYERVGLPNGLVGVGVVWGLLGRDIWQLMGLIWVLWRGHVNGVSLVENFPFN